jgi:hypothetical protein
MNSLTELLSNRIFWEVILGYWVFSAAVGALPTPPVGTSMFYVFFFRFCHILSGNVNRAAVSLKVPGAQEEAK